MKCNIDMISFCNRREELNVRGVTEMPEGEKQAARRISPSALPGMAHVRRWLTPPSRLLVRIRWVYLALGLWNGLIMMPVLFWVGGSSIWLALTGLLAVTALAWCWSLMYRKGDALPAIVDLGEAAAVFVTALAVGNPKSALLLIYVGIQYRALTLPRARAFVGAGAYLLAYLAAEAISPTGNPLALWTLAQIPQVLAATAVGHILHESLANLDQLNRREQVLLSASTGLVGATDRASIYAAVMPAVQALVESATGHVWLAVGPLDALAVVAADGAPAVSRSISLPQTLLAPLQSGQMAALERSREPMLFTEMGLPLQVSAMVLVPLLVQGQVRGVLGVATEGALPADSKGALAALGAQAALAMESSTLSEDLLRQESEARFRSLVQNTSDVIMVMSEDTVIQYVSPAVRRILGYEPGGVTGRKLRELLHPDDVTTVGAWLVRAVQQPAAPAPVIEWRWRHQNGTWRFGEATVMNLMHDPVLKGLVLTTRDITEQKALEEQLTQQAFYDHLTNLANRALFQVSVARALGRHFLQDSLVHVLLLDLDGFKTINESMGHSVGDELLVAAAERIRECVPPGEIMARLGGDEFAIMLEGAEAEEAVVLARRITEALRLPFRLLEKEVLVHASIGIASGLIGRATAEELLRNADVAMYTAKSRGRDRFEVFHPSMHAAVLDRLELETDLRRAIEQQELAVYYQPIVSLQSGTISGLEALVRWQHPIRGMQVPSQFIALAEETGLILPLGRLVLREACRQVKLWQERFGLPLTVSVNLSVKQLHDPGLVQTVASALLDSGLAPGRLVLEITESIWLQGTEDVQERLQALKALGVRLAIDDFGTGYSSLSYLRRLPIDIVKIDKTFVDGIADGAQGAAIVRAILEMVHALQLQSVAEGIEAAEQMNELRSLRCLLGQGYFFTRPLEPGQIEGMLSRDFRVSGDPA